MPAVGLLASIDRRDEDLQRWAGGGFGRGWFSGGRTAVFGGHARCGRQAQADEQHDHEALPPPALCGPAANPQPPEPPRRGESRRSEGRPPGCSGDAVEGRDDPERGHAGEQADENGPSQTRACHQQGAEAGRQTGKHRRGRQDAGVHQYDTCVGAGITRRHEQKSAKPFGVFAGGLADGNVWLVFPTDRKQPRDPIAASRVPDDAV